MKTKVLGSRKELGLGRGGFAEEYMDVVDIWIRNTWMEYIDEVDQPTLFTETSQTTLN